MYIHEMTRMDALPNGAAETAPIWDFKFEFSDEQLRPDLVLTLDTFVNETFALIKDPSDSPAQPEPAHA